MSGKVIENKSLRQINTHSMKSNINCMKSAFTNIGAEIITQDTQKCAPKGVNYLSSPQNK